MRQSPSRGSPRPRGYIHQTYLFFYFLWKNRVLTKSQLIHGRFYLFSRFYAENTCNSTPLSRTLTISSYNNLLTALLAHDEQHLGTLNRGCLEIFTLHSVKWNYVYYSINPSRTELENQTGTSKRKQRHIDINIHKIYI